MRWSNILLWVFFLNKKSANQTKNPLKNLRKEVLSQVSFSSVILIPETLCVWVMVIPSLLHCKHFCLLVFFFPFFLSLSQLLLVSVLQCTHTKYIVLSTCFRTENLNRRQLRTLWVYTHTHVYTQLEAISLCSATREKRPILPCLFRRRNPKTLLREKCIFSILLFPPSNLTQEKTFNCNHCGTLEQREQSHRSWYSSEELHISTYTADIRDLKNRISEISLKTKSLNAEQNISL